MLGLNPWVLLGLAAAFATTAAGGFWAGKEWEQGQQAQREQEAQQARESDAKQQRQFNDITAGRHAAQLASINAKLGAAREQIAHLSGRPCLDPRTVGMLNDINVPTDSGTTSGEPESSSATASSGGGLRWSTDRDVAGALAVCRARYTEVSGQLNAILDIEDRRFPPAKP